MGVYIMTDGTDTSNNGFPVGTDGISELENWSAVKATGDQGCVANYIYPRQPVTELVYVCSPIKKTVNFIIDGVLTADSTTTAAINVAEGTAPTILDAAWLNSVQRELIAILSAAAIAPDPLNDEQVITSLKKLFLQISNNLSEIKTAGTAAQSSARANIAAAALAGLATQVFSVATATANAHAVNLLQLNNAISALSLGNASTKTVGTGANQIPDMNSFTRGTGYFKLPNGIIVQYIQGTTNTSAAAQISYPIPFPTGALVVASPIDVNVANYIAAANYIASACLLSAYTSANVRAATMAYIIAIGI